MGQAEKNQVDIKITVNADEISNEDLANLKLSIQGTIGSESIAHGAIDQAPAHGDYTEFELGLEVDIYSDFTKISATGEDLPSSASQWSCVRDKVTGYIWEVKTASDTGLHAINNFYRWGGIGAEQVGTEFYDDWNVLVNGSQGLCGFNDWRVPSKDELVALSKKGTRDKLFMIRFIPAYNTEKC